LRPQSLAKESGKDVESSMDVGSASTMETDAQGIAPTSGTSASAAAPAKGAAPPLGLTLSAKLAAKRKAADGDSAASPSKARR